MTINNNEHHHFFVREGYSYIYNPYMCLIYEVLEAITTSLMMTSAVAYSAELSTPSTLATVQGMIAGTYYGIGIRLFKQFLKIYMNIFDCLKKKVEDLAVLLADF